MASKFSKMTSEQKIKRALAALDSAVQAWYAEHNPENKEHYADATFMDTGRYNTHVSRITLNSDPEGKKFIEIRRRRHGYGKSKCN